MAARWAVLAGVVAITGAAAGGGWAAGRQLKSPADAAAEREAPEASVITAPVELRTLASNVIFRGSIAFAEPRAVSLAGAVGTGDAPSGSAPPSVITAVPAVSDEITEGSVLVQVSGRPVFAMVGLLPMYRALTPGSNGDDVRQLEEALARMGFDPGPIDGVYDDSTERAVDGLYEAKGFTSQGPSPEQREQLRTARSAVTSAEQSVTAARKALADGSKPAPESEILGLQLAVDEARKALDDALAGPTEAAVAELQRAIDSAELSLKQTKASIARDELSERQDLDARNKAVSTAQTEYLKALSDLTKAQLPGAVNPTTSEPYTAEEIKTLVDAVAAKNEAQQAAQASLELTLASVEPNQLSRQAQLVAAEQAVADARKKLDELKAPKPEPELAKLRLALTQAEQRLAEGKAPKDTSALVEGVNAADRGLFAALSELNKIEVQVGTTVPAGEVVFLPVLPLRVNEVKVKIGDAASSQLLTLSGADIAVRASVSSNDVDLLKVGAVASVEVFDLARTMEATISEIAERPGTDGAGEGRFAVVLMPTDLVAATEATGFSVRITVPIESTDGQAVLAVPLAALSTSADGTSRIEILADDDTRRTVDVAVGLTAQGYAQVTPLDDAPLDEGEQVVIGLESTGVGDEELSEFDDLGG